MLHSKSFLSKLFTPFLLRRIKKRKFIRIILYCSEELETLDYSSTLKSSVSKSLFLSSLGRIKKIIQFGKSFSSKTWRLWINISSKSHVQGYIGRPSSKSIFSKSFHVPMHTRSNRLAWNRRYDRLSQKILFNTTHESTTILILIYPSSTDRSLLFLSPRAPSHPSHPPWWFVDSTKEKQLYLKKSILLRRFNRPPRGCTDSNWVFSSKGTLKLPLTRSIISMN